MIQIKIDDTIVDIVEKMENIKESEIILDFPLWHPILHNYISLKILKSKAWDKRLIIATSDKIWKKIWKKIWIEYSNVKNKKFIESHSQSSLLGYNYSFWEYFRFQISSYKNEILHNIQSHKKFHSLGKYSRASYEKTSIGIFIIWLIWSIIIFLFIYYFAISKTYINISPDIIIKKQAYNFVFSQNVPDSVLWNNKYVKIDTLSKTLYSSDTYAATQILENDNISSWEVRIYNNLGTAQTLIPNTRLLTDEWIIFRTDSWVEIPAATTDNFWNTSPWIAKVSVKADPRDLSWNFVGENWNIQEGVKMILPGLDENLQSEIYAESDISFSWWTNNFQKIVSQEDIDRALDIFSKKIKNEVIVSIKNSILSKNNENNTKIDLLPGPNSIRYESPIINIQEWVQAWDIRDNFKVEWSITAYVYTYNRETVIQRLKTLLNEKRLEWIEKISYIDENSLRMSETIYTEKSPFSMKSTFEIEAVYTHDFQHKDNTFIDSLKQQIRWLPKQEAERFLLNNPKISNVTIDIRPFFSKNISNIYKNIIFNIE